MVPQCNMLLCPRVFGLQQYGNLCNSADYTLAKIFLGANGIHTRRKVLNGGGGAKVQNIGGGGRRWGGQKFRWL